MRKPVFLALGLAACVFAVGCNSDQGTAGKEQAAASSATAQASAILGRKAACLEEALSRRSAATRVFDELLVRLPGRLWLTEGSLDGRAVRVMGRAPSNNLVADYVAELEQSAVLDGVDLLRSTQRGDPNTGYVDFDIQASVREAGGNAASAPSREPELGPSGALDRRMGELEALVTASGGTAGALRDLQNVANDAHISVTTFAPAAQKAGELYNEGTVLVRVRGSREALGRYLAAIAALPQLWLVDKLTFQAESAGDPRSPVLASLSVRTFVLRDADRSAAR